MFPLLETSCSLIICLSCRSKFPLSIILVGVGDGPWDMMKEFDDNIPARAFDNFQVTDDIKLSLYLPVEVDPVNHSGFLLLLP